MGCSQSQEEERMRRKTVATWSIVIFLIVIGIGVGYKMYDNDTANYDMWSSKWGITISKPSESEVVFESEPSFHGDGENYFILDYNEQQLSQLRDQVIWQPINEGSRNALDAEVQRFYQSVTESYPQEMAAEYNTGDDYYYKKKEDGSYCIVILNVDKQRLYLMEWIQ